MKKISDVFASRLKKVIGKDPLTIAADKMKISRVALNHYLKAERKPDIEILCKIATAYNVSADYLIGRSDVMRTDPDLKSACEYTGLDDETVALLHNKYSSGKYHNYFMALSTLFFPLEVPGWENEKSLAELIAQYWTAYYKYYNYDDKGERLEVNDINFYDAVNAEKATINNLLVAADSAILEKIMDGLKLLRKEYLEMLADDDYRQNVFKAK